ncbi:MAG: 23S rRNA (pseudouridine(1915)-N(3))-methyltransferase RlmH [Robiginitomaculum sp.]|nr:MAG: 23S rRNA (pseudouridine(1915)-N(3))-methyltransferase RlmH [Robiginitomaculum sp.]
MKITIRAASLIKSGPERELITDYLKRANGISRNLGITEVSESAVDTRSAKSRTDETNTILSRTNPTDIVVILDERGKALTSRQMAKQIARWRDDGHRQLTIAIGGADGFEPSALPANTIKWSFGIQTWPHKLVRVMIAEQIYRALSILAGSPYHRD